MDNRETLVDIKNLRTFFYTEDGVVPAVDGINLTIHRGEVVGLVGESGCGKSVTALSIMRSLKARYSSMGKTSSRKMKKRCVRYGATRSL